MSKTLTIEVSDELYAAMQAAAQRQSRSPEEVGLAQWQRVFGPHPNGKANGAHAENKPELDLPDDDPLAEFIGSIDASHCPPDWIDNHDYYLGLSYMDTHDDEDEGTKL